jgi:hypothetical protein
MTLLNQNDLKPAVAALNWLFQHKVGYLSNTLHRFVFSNGTLVLREEPKQQGGLPIVIVARHRYQEFVKSYPITSLKELHAVLGQEYADKTLVKHVISAADGNQRRVCTYVFSKDIAETLASAVMVLPESLLLWLGSSTPAIYHVKTELPFFLATSSDLPLSQRLNPVLQNADTFKLSQGLPSETPIRDIAADQLPSALYSGFKRSAFSSTLNLFWKLPRARWSATQLKLAGIGAITTLVVYFGAASLYLQLSVSQHEQAIAELGSEVNSLLDRQSRYEKQVEDFNQYQAMKQEKQFTAHLWLLLSTLNDQDPTLELNSVNSEEQFLVLRGKTSRATALLALVQANPLVVYSEFSAPVLREGDKESFVIRLQLNQQAKVQGADSDAK